MKQLSCIYILFSLTEIYMGSDVKHINYSRMKLLWVKQLFCAYILISILLEFSWVLIWNSSTTYNIVNTHSFNQSANCICRNDIKQFTLEVIKGTYLSFLLFPFCCFPARILSSSSEGCWYHLKLKEEKNALLKKLLNLPDYLFILQIFTESRICEDIVGNNQVATVMQTDTAA